MKYFLLALQFLTVIPVRIKNQTGGNDYQRSLNYYALAGGIIGAILGGIGYGLYFLSNSLAAAIVVTTEIFITGGLHIDGFADSCDGLYGDKPKDERLRIMRDSRIGAIGVMGITCLLLLKYVLIMNIPHNLIIPSLLCMGVFSRFCLIFTGSISSYARENGKAEFVFLGAGKKEMLSNLLLTLCVFLLFYQGNGIILFLSSIAVIYIAVQWIKNKLNGMTGDTLGMVNEIAELCVLLGCYGISRLHTHIISV